MMHFITNYQSIHHQRYSLGGSDGKESACNAGDLGLIPGLGRSPGEGKGYPLQCSGLENPMDYSGFQALWTEKPGGLQSMWSQRVRHNWVTFTSHHVYKWAPGPKHLKSILFSSPRFTPRQTFHYLLAGPMADFLPAFLWEEGRLILPDKFSILPYQYLTMTEEDQESRFIIECSYLFLVKCSIFYCSPWMIHNHVSAGKLKLGI